MISRGGVAAVLSRCGLMGTLFLAAVCTAVGVAGPAAASDSTGVDARGVAACTSGGSLVKELVGQTLYVRNCSGATRRVTAQYFSPGNPLPNDYACTSVRANGVASWFVHAGFSVGSAKFC
ncbi:hypothetical protein GCM10009851_05810 [Herbiconiux moechotypicola]|uniref:Secreted protein n=1 Tax=Herbiconiux moechotypicola TaxID=637393 RepID=A0ABP5Q3E0_9MICO